MLQLGESEKLHYYLRPIPFPPMVTFPFQFVVAIGSGWGWYRLPASTTSHGVIAFGRLWVVLVNRDTAPDPLRVFGSDYVYFEASDSKLMIVKFVEALYELRGEHFDFFVHLRSVNRLVAEVYEIDVGPRFDRVGRGVVW
jgi:hypothetical protein